MLIMEYTFTRPNELVNFYFPAEIKAVSDEIRKAQEIGDMIGFSDDLSLDNLVMTRTIFILDAAALTRITSNVTLSANTQARISYNDANGITESLFCHLLED